MRTRTDEEPPRVRPAPSLKSKAKPLPAKPTEPAGLAENPGFNAAQAEKEKDAEPIPMEQ